MNIKLVKGNIILFAIVPLLTIIIFTLNNAYKNYQVYSKSKEVEQIVSLGTTMSLLVHELQKERGLSSGYVGSKGENFAQKLGQQTILTDEKVKNYFDHTAQYETGTSSAEINYLLNIIELDLKRLQDKREKTKALISNLNDVINYYTSLNTKLINSIGLIAELANNHIIVKNINAYYSFLQEKERAGLERAIISNVLTKDKFNKDLFVNFITLVAAQESYHNISFYASDQSIRDFYNRILMQDSILEVDKMRSILMNKGVGEDINIDPKYWFDKITLKINLLKNVEDLHISNLKRNLQNIKNEHLSSFYYSLTIGLSIVIFLILFFILSSKQLIKKYDLLIDEIKRSNNTNIKTYEDTLYTLVDIIEKRDTYTAGHTQRVAKYSKLIAKELNCSDEEISLLEKSALLHDIGKIQTPDNVLLKPFKLTDLEYQVIKEHSETGYQILKKISSYSDIAEIVKYHHERCDGRGYPNGIKGDEIPKLARILMVADSFDAMTTNRIYKPRKTIEEAIEEIISLSGEQFHPEIVEVTKKALQDVVIESKIHQKPVTTLEKERFAYFYRDQLTQCYNKEFYNLKLVENNSIGEFKSKTEIQLKNFSQYNQKHGWDMGDLILKSIAKELQEYFPDSLIFRIEGDDFIALHNSSDSFKCSRTLITHIRHICNDSVLNIICEDSKL